MKKNARLNFGIGDLVQKEGRKGIGIVVEPSYDMAPGFVAVRWETGVFPEPIRDLSVVPEKRDRKSRR